MKRQISSAAFCLLVFASIAAAYDFPLQFTPNSGYRGLVVAGYAFEGRNVVGNCSYYTVSGSSSSGKGGGGRSPVTNRYDQTCRWDLFGNLLSITPGAPLDRPPLYTTGTKTVYAENGDGNVTGSDTKLPDHGFVTTPSPHYTWLTPSTNAVLAQLVYTIDTTLKSDGDGPVNITALDASVAQGVVVVKNTTCIGTIETGGTCSISLTYDAGRLTSATGLAYDTLRINLTSDAGGSHDFVQKFTIILPEH